MAYMQSLANDSQYNGTELASLNNEFIYPGLNPQTAKDKAAGIAPNLNIASVVERLRKNSSYNYFIDEFVSLRDVNNEHNYEGIDMIITNNFTRLSDANLTNIQNDILSLYSNPRTHKDTIHLINYLLVKDGFMYGKNSFLSVIPVDLTKNILNSIDKVQKLFNSEKRTDEAFKRVFGKTFLDLKELVVFEYLQRTSNKYFTRKKDAEKIPTSYERTYEEPEFDDGRILIDQNVEDSASQSNMLSRTGARSFEYGGNTFYSIEHAYQVMYGGIYDQNLDKKWKKTKEDPAESIPGKKAKGKLKSKKKAKDKLALLSQLTKLSILQSANMEDETGVPLGQLVVTNTQFDFLQETKEEADAIRQGILQARKELKMELVKDKEGVEGYKYISNDRIAKREKASQEAKKSPIHNNLETKEFTIDLYKGLPTFYTDRVKKIRRLKKQAKGDMTGSEGLKANASIIRKAGFFVGMRPIKVGGKTVMRFEVDVPVVFLMPNREGVLEVYKLKEVQRDGDYKAEDKLDLLLPKGETKVYGNFIRFENLGSLKGSRAQNQLAFLFGKTLTEQEINEFNLQKFAIDPNDIEDDFEAKEEFESTEENVDQDQITQLFSGTGTVTKTETQTEEENDTFDFEAEQENVETDASMLESKETLSQQLELTKDDLVKNWYDNLSEDDKIKVGDREELINTYLSYPIDAEEYIENIKKCYLK